MSVAKLIADLVAAGTPAELVGRVAEALAERPVVPVKDDVAERRRAYDRERKAAKRGNSGGIPPETTGNHRNSTGTDTPPDGTPFPPAPPIPPLNPPDHTTPRGRAALDDLENRLREAAGYQQSPHPKLQILAPILGLLDQGMSLDEDVLPVIRSKATQLRQHGRPDAVSWEFFRNAIVEHHHARKRAIVVPFSTAGPRQQPETQMELVRRVLAEGKT